MANKPYSIDVPSAASVKVMPERNLKEAADWSTTEVVAQGVIRKNNNRFYMAVIAGTCGATAPVHASGIVSDDAVTWLFVPKGPRKGGSLVNRSSVDIFGSVGYPAVDEEGIPLVANGGFYNVPDDIQNAIYLIAASGTTNSVVIEEL